MWIMMLLGGLVADLLQKKKILSTTNVRKLANGVGKSTFVRQQLIRPTRHWLCDQVVSLFVCP